MSIHLVDFQELALQGLNALAGDMPGIAEFLFIQDFADGADGAGGAYRILPLASELLDVGRHQLAGGVDGFFKAFLVNLAVGEIAHAETDAAHGQAFQ